MQLESSSLPQEANAVLEGLWRRVRDDAERIKRDQLRIIASRVSMSAREVGLHPEELIIAIKQSWQESRPRPPAEHRWILTETIALCIEEYYRWQHANADARRVDSA